MKSWRTVLTVALACLAGIGAWLYSPDKSRDSLSPSYVRGPGDFVDVAGIRLHLRDDGPRDAPAVILLHGFGASLHTWEPWAAMLSQSMRVIRFDLPGFGLTGADPTGNYSDARSLEIIAAVMDRLGLARASLAGNSIGGRIAWKFAAAWPARTDRLILIAPDGFASPGFEYGKAPEISATLKLMRFVLPAAAVRMSLAPAYGDPAFLTDSLVRRYRDLMLAPGVRAAMLARLEQSILVAPEPLLRTIHAPTLLMWGEKDQMIPFTNAADYQRLLPNATLKSYPALGHVPHEESPSETAAAAREFLLPTAAR